MKRFVCVIICLLVLFFSISCNKEKKDEKKDYVRCELCGKVKAYETSRVPNMSTFELAYYCDACKHGYKYEANWFTGERVSKMEIF